MPVSKKTHDAAMAALAGHLSGANRLRGRRQRATFEELTPEAQEYLRFIAGARDGQPPVQVSPDNPWLKRTPIDLTPETDEQLLARLTDRSRLTAEEKKFRLTSYWPRTIQRARALEEVKTLLETRHGWLTLWGGNGSGKSYLAVSLINASLEQRRGAQYWMLADLLDALREAYHPERGEQDYNALLDTLIRLPLLVVDECHAFNPTSWALEKFRQLLEARYREAASTATLWVCNVDPALEGGELSSLFSRMRQHTLVQVDDGDVRPAKGRDLRAPEEE